MMRMLLELTANFMEVEMKSIVKIVCCAVAFAWMLGASAEEDSQASAADTQVAGATSGAAGTTAAAGGDAAPAAAPDDVVVPTPPAPRIAVTPYRDKVDRAKVEKRLTDKSDRTKKRTAEAERDALERAAKTQAGQ